MSQALSIAPGQKFGRLVTISYTTPKWRCQCACGTIVFILSGNLKCGRTKSCGCFRNEWAKTGHITHGLTKGHQWPSEYGIWQGIKSRCRLKTNHAYSHYGGRGIDVCDRWFNSFIDFLTDMGPRPSSKHSVERINNSDNYFPENCRWATQKEQGRNKRTNRLLTFNGKIQPLSAWAEELQISDGVIYDRLKDGWSVDRALSTPVRKCVRKMAN